MAVSGCQARAADVNFAGGGQQGGRCNRQSAIHNDLGFPGLGWGFFRRSLLFSRRRAGTGTIRTPVMSSATNVHAARARRARREQKMTKR